MSTTTYRIWHTACRISYTSSGVAITGGRIGNGTNLVVVRTLRRKYLMLHTRPRTLHVHDDIPHMLHCMAYTSSGDDSRGSNRVSRTSSNFGNKNSSGGSGSSNSSSSSSSRSSRSSSHNCIWELEIFWWQAQSEGERATTESGNLRFFGSRPSPKVTGLQLQSGNSRFFGAVLIRRRQGFNFNLGSRNFNIQLISR